MTPYKRMLLEKQKMCCINCKYLYQEQRQNTVEGTDHINYCKKSGKIILEMHIGTNGRNCFEKESESE